MKDIKDIKTEPYTIRIKIQGDIFNREFFSWEDTNIV